MKLKDLFENKEYTFAQWAKDKDIDLNSGVIDCSSAKITSLQGAPTSVAGSFNCSSTKITSLEGASTSVGGSFNCYDTNITSLEGAPNSIGNSFSCGSTKITSLEGAPTSIAGNFYCNNTKITSLENIHHHIHHIGYGLFLNDCPIKSNVLGTLWIGCDEQGRPLPDGEEPLFIRLDNKQVEEILNRYLDKIHSKEMTPREALLQAQNELQDAGLDEYADL